VLVLAMAMLVVGGHLLTGGLTILHAVSGGTPATSTEPLPSPPTLEGVRAIRASFALAHPWAVRANAASKILLAGLLLYAVAAVWSSDRRARLAAMLAAWVGIGYHVGDALFLFFVVRKGVVAAAPLLANWAASQAAPGRAVPSVQELVSMTDLLIVGTGLVGIAFSVLLLTFFGGRRGRVLFGPGQQPHHGG
jgi:hypothetical protein